MKNIILPIALLSLNVCAAAATPVTEERAWSE